MLSTVKKLAPLAVAVLASTTLVAGCGQDASGSNETPAALTVLYRKDSANAVRLYVAVKEQLVAAGVTVDGLPASDQEYSEILQDPVGTQRGAWDLAVAGRSAEGTGDDEASIIEPLFDGEAAFPPLGSNYGRYQNAEVSEAIEAARNSGDPQAWSAVDQLVTADAAVFPVAEPLQANYTSRNVRSKLFVPAYQNFDPTRITKDSRPGPRKAPGDKSLYLLGTGDVDTMDPNLSDYSVGLMALRLWSRQLYAYPAGSGSAPTPDLAVGQPAVARTTLADGSTGTSVTFTLQPRASWNVGKAGRRIVAADVLRGVKRSCARTPRFGGDERYLDLVDGLRSFCDQYRSQGQPGSMLATPVPGLAGRDRTVTIRLRAEGVTARAARALLTSPAFSPAPVEYETTPPGDQPTSLIASGPYRVASYTPGAGIVFTPNPRWDDASDPRGPRQFSRIQVVEGLTQKAVQQKLRAQDPRADLEWDSFVPLQEVATLAKRRDPGLTRYPGAALDPYLVFNTRSPFADGALAEKGFRAALSSALDRNALIEALGGPALYRPAARVLPPSLAGATPAFAGDGYDPAAAKDALAAYLR